MTRIYKTPNAFIKKLSRVNGLSCRAHEVITHAHEIIGRAHEIIGRAHEILCRAQDIIYFQKRLRVPNIRPYSCDYKSYVQFI